MGKSAFKPTIKNVEQPTPNDRLIQSIQMSLLTVSSLWVFFEILAHIQQNLARIIRLNMVYLNVFVLGYTVSLFFIFSILFSLLSLVKSNKIDSNIIASAFSFLIFALLVLIFIQLGVNFAIVTGRL